MDSRFQRKLCVIVVKIKQGAERLPVERLFSTSLDTNNLPISYQPGIDSVQK